MPVVVVGGCDVGPSTTSESAKNADPSNKTWEGGVRSSGHKVPQSNKGESWSGCDGNEDLEDGSLGVAVANRGGDGWEPFIRIALAKLDK